MAPVLFSIGSLPIRAYSVSLLLAMAAGFLVLRQEWKESGLRWGSIYVFCAGAIVSGLVGGRLGYVALHAADYAAEPGRLLHFWQEGGEIAWGAIGALLAWSWAYSRHVRANTADFFDALVPPAALAEGLMRWGCLLNGCCHGREATGFPGMLLPDTSGQWLYRYPTQVLYSAVALGLFILLWAGRRSRPFPGFSTVLYLTLYAAARLAIGPLRGDYATPQSRMVSLGLDLVLLSVGVGALIGRVVRSRKVGEVAW